ncbi:hypothetical protein GP486_002779 [Trichoglossum hirsutum]|uniref:H+/nucleoside cotransporter n=1 Tax=Trichoglossum hirsutum TaxID=265104 RepID=A0A9P8RRC7_9PEZI|nr:hypothetical protein GP486_002779 [Trichoglossum hirsutum]
MSNLGPELDPTHLHPVLGAGEGQEDNEVYTVSATGEKSMTPNVNPKDYALHRRHHPERQVSGKEPSKDAAVDPDQERHAENEDPKSSAVAKYYTKYKVFVHLFVGLLITGWWIASLILHHPGRDYKNWVIPFLLWLAITLRLLFFYVPITTVTGPMHFVWNNIGVRAGNRIPEKFRVPFAAALVVAVICVGAFASPEIEDNTRANRAVSLFGLAVTIFVLWATSRNRRKIVWHTVIVGMLLQFIIALFVLRTRTGYDVFSFVSGLCSSLLGFTKKSVIFLTDESIPKLPWFLTSVTPPVIFFVSFVQLLYYWGILQWIIAKFAVFFFWSLRVSGAEAVVAAATPFIGQGESAMLIKPFVAHLTKAELHQANGAWLGLKIAGMIVGMIICIITLIGLIDGILTWWGRYINIGPGEHDLTLELILSYLFYPVAFLLGVPRQDLLAVARLIGLKVIANEFVAYSALQTQPMYANLSRRSRLIATYSLCGFGNISALGIQIGVLSQISPERVGDVSRLALSALVSGIISTLTSASIAGMFLPRGRM